MLPAPATHPSSPQAAAWPAQPAAPAAVRGARSPTAAVVLVDLGASRCASPLLPDNACGGRGARLQPPYRPGDDVRGWAARLAWCLAQPERPRSWRPLLYPGLTGGGKFGLCYGAYLVGLEGVGAGRPWLPGVVTLCVSAAMVVTGVVLLGGAVGQLSPRGARLLKAGSLTGGALMGVGYGAGGYAVHHPDALWAIAVGPTLKALGAGMMGYTLPSFIGNAEAVLGDLPLGRDRGTAAMATFMAGIAILMGSTSLVGNHTPPAAYQAVVNVGAFAVMLALGIGYRDIRPWPVASLASVATGRRASAASTASAASAASAPSAASPGTAAGARGRTVRVDSVELAMLPELRAQA